MATFILFINSLNERLNGSPLALRAGVAGPWGRTCHWRVCWAGALHSPDRQQRAAASAGGPPGRAQSGYHSSESDRANGPVKLGCRRRAGVAGPRARVSRAVVPRLACGVVGGLYRQVATARMGGDSNGRRPSSATARLGRCGPRDRPAVDGGPEPGWTGDSESAARRAVSSQGEGARR